MKKFTLTLLTLAVLPLLAGCLPAVEGGNNNTEPAVPAGRQANTYTQNGAEITEQADVGMEDAVTWQEVYAQILRDHLARLASAADAHGYFIVRDMDGDGSPDLVVFEATAEHLITNIHAYSFRQSGLAAIETNHALTGQPLSLVYVPTRDNSHGVIVFSAVIAGPTTQTHLVIEGNTLTQYMTGSSRWVFVPDQGSTFVADIDENDVSEEEFRTVFELWTGDMSRRITENNIRLFEIRYGAAFEPLGSWQKAYAALLEYYLPQYEGDFGNLPRSFILHDIDMDGTPELIILEVRRNWALDIVSVYGFAAGTLRIIETNLIFEGTANFFAPQDNNGGIIAVTVIGPPVDYERLIIDGNRLVRYASGMVDSLSLFEGAVFWTIDGVGNVSEEEFFNVFALRNRWESESIMHDITAENIQRVISAW